MDLAPGTITGGLKRLEPLFTPVYEALLARGVQAGFAQADETPWLVFVEREGKVGHPWWLWVFLTEDTVVFRLDATRSHEVPEGHVVFAFRHAESRRPEPTLVVKVVPRKLR